MATLAQVRADIATNLGNISGLAISTRPRDQVSEWPMAVIGWPDRIEYDVTLHGSVGGYVRYHIPVRLYVGRYDADESTVAVDAYVAPTGASSVKANIEAAGATSGWSWCNVPEVGEFAIYDVAGQPMIGAEFLVEVLAA